MIHGVRRDRFPRITIEVFGADGPRDTEVIVDTGFDDDLALPAPTIRDLGLLPVSMMRRRMADRSIRECKSYDAEVRLDGVTQIAEVLELDKPLIGTFILEGWQLSVDLTEGGEVSIESPE